MLIQAEKRFKVTLFVETPDNGGKESEEEESQDDLCAAWASFQDWNRGVLNRSEGRSLFLNFHFGLPDLTSQLLTDATLKGQFILKF